jgi:hypothetical protein
MLVVPLLLLLLPALSLAQDGSISGPTSSSDAAGYSCDTSACQLPKCNCASTSPPGGLSPVRNPFLKSTALSCCPVSSFILKEAISGFNHYRRLTSISRLDKFLILLVVRVMSPNLSSIPPTMPSNPTHLIQSISSLLSVRIRMAVLPE